MKSNKIREQILNESSYWVEGINSFLYDVIEEYMDNNSMKTQKSLAKHLGISKGRVSQILNEGDINFSLEKVIDIALKMDKFPDFKFIDKSVYLENERKHFLEKSKLLLNKGSNSAMEVSSDSAIVIPMYGLKSEFHNVDNSFSEINFLKEQHVG